MKREIEHKALLPQVQALYTRATYYLVSSYKTISHQSSVRISHRITKAISQPMSHRSSVSKGRTASARRCYDRASWTGLSLFLSIYFPFFFHYGTMGTLPSLLETVLSWTYLPIPKTGSRCLADCAPPPLSITCPILAPTVLPTCASVPADVHPLCPFCARISSPLPYVPLHHLCTLPDPLTCVVPRPLYTP